MTLPTDLLAQADYLAKREPRRPKQASLRRAISSAYYALFHLLTSEASRMFMKDERLWKCVNRVYGHVEINTISKSFAQGDWPKAFDAVKGVFPLPQELKDVARAFVNLQQARHNADYHLAQTFTRSETMDFVDMARKAFADWTKVKNNDLARIYLASFLLWEKWSKTR
jgi:hypothetical protein